MGGNDLMLTAGSICAGMGALEMGISEVIPLTLRWVAEYEPPTEKNPNPRQAAARLLAHRHPEVPNLGDITAVDWPVTARVDVICGGTPCQDMSAAGLRSGMRAGTRSGIWASMVEAIATHRPALVVWENVRGALSVAADSSVESCPICMGDERECHLRALGRVLGDLADLGYDAAWCGLRAADVGAPHARYRIFVLAWPAEDPDRTASGQRRQPAPGQTPGRGPRAGGHGPTLADQIEQQLTTDADDNGWASFLAGGSAAPGSGTAGDRWPATADTTGDGRHERRPEPTRHLGGSDAALGGGAAADAHGLGFLGQQPGLGARQDPEGRSTRGTHSSGQSAAAWGDYAEAIHRWEDILRRLAPAPTELSTRGGQRLSPRFVEWMMGVPDGWVTGVPGLSRNDQLKILGNGVVPQQAAEAIRRLMPYTPAWVRERIGWADTRTYSPVA